MRTGHSVAKKNTSVDSQDREYVAGLEKGLAVIDAFERLQSPLTVSEAGHSAGISRAAARRCLRTLEQLGYAEYDGKYYRLLPAILSLGHAYVSSNPLPRFVQPIIEAISEHTQRSMTVAVLSRNDILVIARAHVRRSLASGLGIGARLPAHCSANGRILLSTLPDVQLERLFKQANLPALTAHTKVNPREVLKEVRLARIRGYATNEQEVELGVRTIAVPIRTRSGAVIASLSMSAPVGDTGKNALMKLLPQLEIARSRIESTL
jgi:IclR family transcriptional regulator, pca regulon regulatory protein